jgi:hypothetical protein
VRGGTVGSDGRGCENVVAEAETGVGIRGWSLVELVALGVVECEVTDERRACGWRVVRKGMLDLRGGFECRCRGGGNISRTEGRNHRHTSQVLMIS